jgi:glyoxylase-like metal-dependent hydrolase (beta-lactamase superfamily II)
MILRQFLHTDPAVAASYLVGCGGKAAGAVVDPVGDPDIYIRAADETALRIRCVIDTHAHADHVSSGREFARETGAEYVLHADAGAAYDHRAVRAFAGSVCGRGLSGNPGSTIGFERRFNRGFGIADREAFVEYMLRDIPPPPPHAARVRAENLGLLQPA